MANEQMIGEQNTPLDKEAEPSIRLDFLVNVVLKHGGTIVPHAIRLD